MPTNRVWAQFFAVRKRALELSAHTILWFWSCDFGMLIYCNIGAMRWRAEMKVSASAMVL